MSPLAVFRVVLLAVVALFSLAVASEPLSTPRTTVLLTVTGAIQHTNHGAYNATRDLYFKRLNVTFEPAAAFDGTMLSALPSHIVDADFPKGAPARRFTGPRLVDVLAAAGATGSKVLVRALDGYGVEVSIADMQKYGVILATVVDGTPLGLGGFGPCWVVFPRLDMAELADSNDDFWVWGVVRIDVR